MWKIRPGPFQARDWLLVFGGGESDYWGAQDQEEVAALVNATLDQGVNYFDTAEMYNAGRSEEALGRALKSRRSEAIIGSKVWPNHASPELLRNQSQLTEDVSGVMLQLNNERMSQLTTLTDELKQKLGPNADYFTGSAESRIR